MAVSRAIPTFVEFDADLQIYNRIDKQWQVYANGPVIWGPPCQGKKVQGLSDNCEDYPTRQSYRTVAYVAITEDGDVDAEAKVSPVEKYYCL